MSDSDDSGYSDSESGSDGGSDAGGVADDDFLMGLMPESRLDGDKDDGSDSGSEDDAPLTAAQIRALRASAASGATEASTKIDYAEQLKGKGRVPMMIAISAGDNSTSSDVLRIDWARITKDDMEKFIDIYAGAIDVVAQTTREAARTPAWLLQHSVRTCLSRMVELLKQEGGEDALLAELGRVSEQADSANIAEDHLVRRKAEGEPVQASFDHMTDAVHDVCQELEQRIGKSCGACSSER